MKGKSSRQTFNTLQCDEVKLIALRIVEAIKRVIGEFEQIHTDKDEISSERGRALKLRVEMELEGSNTFR